MPERLWFRPAQVAATTRVRARCRRCGSAPILDMAALPDLPLIEIEKRLRCTERGRSGQGSACGGRAQIGVWTPSVPGEDGIHGDLPVLRPDLG